MSMERVEALRAALPGLPVKDLAFAKSLIGQWDAKQRLSHNQLYWVDKLTGNDAPQAMPVVDVGDFKKVLALFGEAKKHLKHPRIDLLVGTQSIALSVAGAASKAPGTVNVTDGKPFGQNIWFGRVTPAGEWQVSLRAPEDKLRAVEDFLLEFSQTPAKTASEYGRLTGRCCFCRIKLTDEHSTAAGFGRTCAKNYGLEAEYKAAQPVLENV